MKKELVHYLEGIFGVYTFNNSAVTYTVGNYLKYIWDMYRGNLENNSRYENPPMIPMRKWKALIANVEGKKQRKEEKTPPSAPW